MIIGALEKRLEELNSKYKMKMKALVAIEEHLGEIENERARVRRKIYTVKLKETKNNLITEQGNILGEIKCEILRGKNPRELDSLYERRLDIKRSLLEIDRHDGV